MNDKRQVSEQPNQNHSTLEQSPSHPIATGLGAAGGGVAGAAIGRVAGGRMGATVGAVAGAIAGAIAGDALAELTEEVAEDVGEKLGLGLGADTKEIERPRHYSWDELRELSKPQAASTQAS